MVYYFLAFSILSGTSLLLKPDNLENLMQSFSVCLWCMGKKFETLNENRSLCRAGTVVRRQKSIVFSMKGIMHHPIVRLYCII